MVTVGITSPPATFAVAISSRRRSGLLGRRAVAASLRARCSTTDASAAFSPGEEEAATDVAGAGAGASVSTRPPYSLISTANVQKAIRGLAITDVDHYGRLGINKLASSDEVKVAYETRCEELSSKGLDEEELKKELELMKESFTILSNEQERRLYDWSLARSQKPERYVWPYQVDKMELAPDPPVEPEDVGPTRLVGYFMLAWFLISIVLSVTVNR